MNRCILFIILPLLLAGLSGCGDDGDVEQIDLRLFDGIWEVVNQGNQEVFERNCILDVSASPGMVNGGAQGMITTFYLSVDGTPIHDKVFTWNVRERENHQPLLDLVFKGDLDGDDLWDGNYFYKITELTDTHMSWQVNTVGDNSIIRFRRRSDLKIE